MADHVAAIVWLLNDGPLPEQLGHGGQVQRCEEFFGGLEHFKRCVVLEQKEIYEV